MCALAAIAASVIAKADPITTLVRAMIAFIVGSVLTKAWYVFLAARVADEELSFEEISEPSDERAATEPEAA